MHTIDTRVLTYIFSFLDLKDLANGAQVSKEWNKAHKTDGIWQRFCLDYLEDAKPYQNSWKERFKIMNNWMKASAEVKVYPPCYKAWHKYHDFTFLENHTPLEIYPAYNNPSTYIIYDWSTKKIIKIDLKSVHSSDIICTDLYNKTWVALNSQDKIFCFDIQTGQCTKQIVPPLAESQAEISSAKMKSNDQEIIIAYHQKIKILNSNTGCLETIIDISTLGEVWNLHYTPHYIIYQTYHRGFEEVILPFIKVVAL